MGFDDGMESLATVFKSPAAVIIYAAGFWEFGIAPVIHGTVLFFGAFVGTLLMVEYKDELATTCGLMHAVTGALLSVVWRTVRAICSATKRAAAYLWRKS